MSKAKMQGTKLESDLVKTLTDAGLMSRRIPEGGSKDEGDFEVEINGVRWVGEAKARQSLSVQTALSKARMKAAGSPVLLIWKRLVANPEGSRRKPVAGEAVVVCLSLKDFLKLVGKNEEV